MRARGIMIRRFKNDLSLLKSEAIKGADFRSFFSLASTNTMAASKAVVSVSSPIQSIPPSEPDSQLSGLIYDVSQQVQVAMENMLKMINEIDQCSADIMEEIEKSKESASGRQKFLDDERERFQKAAFTALEMLNARGIN